MHKLFVTKWEVLSELISCRQSIHRTPRSPTVITVVKHYNQVSSQAAQGQNLPATLGLSRFRALTLGSGNLGFVGVRLGIRWGQGFTANPRKF